MKTKRTKFQMIPSRLSRPEESWRTLNLKELNIHLIKYSSFKLNFKLTVTQKMDRVVSELCYLIITNIFSLIPE